MKAARAQAPAGIVTMLFTDIEGSSDSVRALGPDRWESVLPADEMVRGADLAAVRLGMGDSDFDAAFSEGRDARFEDLEAMANEVSNRVIGRGA